MNFTAKHSFEFWDYIRDECTENDILNGKENVVNLFIKYAEEFNLLTRSELENEYQDDISANNGVYESFNDYVYKAYIGLEKDLSCEYKSIKLQIQSKVHEFEKSIAQLASKIETTKEYYQKERSKFILGINVSLYNKAIEKLCYKTLLNSAINSCSALSTILNWVSSFDDFDFMSWEQNPDTDWKHKICFELLPISCAEKMLKLKRHDYLNYLKEYHKYIEDFDICKSIIEIASENHIGFKRLEIFETAINLFESQKYLSLISLTALQIEGLFSDFGNALGVNLKNKNSITDKLIKLRENKSIWGFIYFAFDFPPLRNSIAHGEIPKNNLEETAMDLLTQIHYLLNTINTTSAIPCNFIRKYINASIGLNDSDRINIIVNSLDDIVNKGHLFDYLTLKGNVIDEIVFYQITPELDAVKKLFDKQEFWTTLVQQQENDKNKDCIQKIIGAFSDIGKKYAAKYIKWCSTKDIEFNVDL